MTTPPRIALIGHCGPDSSFLRLAIKKAVPTAHIIGADDQATLDKTLAEGADLLLVNRVLESGYTHSEGVPLIQQLRATHPHLRTMLVSNFPEAHAAAEAAGALPGFGKRDIGSAKVTALLQAALSAPPAK
jgi:hypothetical protein